MNTRILIVDDNDVNLLLISKILDIEGYEVLTARSGREALRSVKENTPDLAILDVMMPEMNGYELCEKLRQPPYNICIPIVMLTAMNSESEQKRAREAGADEVWSKPFDMDVLRQRIGILLAGNGRTS
jgi:CheY-like chemotaxis protein